MISAQRGRGTPRAAGGAAGLTPPCSEGAHSTGNHGHHDTSVLVQLQHPVPTAVRLVVGNLGESARSQGFA